MVLVMMACVVLGRGGRGVGVRLNVVVEGVGVCAGWLVVVVVVGVEMVVVVVVVGRNRRLPDSHHRPVRSALPLFTVGSGGVVVVAVDGEGGSGGGGSCRCCWSCWFWLVVFVVVGVGVVVSGGGDRGGSDDGDGGRGRSSRVYGRSVFWGMGVVAGGAEAVRELVGANVVGF